MKHVAVFEALLPEADAEKELDQLLFLWKNGVETSETLEFSDAPSGWWDIEVHSVVGDFVFSYDSEEYGDFDGDSWDLTIYYAKEAGDWVYYCEFFAKNNGTVDDPKVELIRIDDIFKKPRTKNGTRKL